jgi:hypothetical protein
LLKPDQTQAVDTKTKYGKYSEKYSISGEQ